MKIHRTLNGIINALDEALSTRWDIDRPLSRNKCGQGTGGCWNFEVSQFCVRNFVKQIGCEISHAKSRGLCEISRTLSPQSLRHHNISGSVRETYHTKSRDLCEIPGNEISHGEFDLARNSPPPPLCVHHSWAQPSWVYSLLDVIPRLRPVYCTLMCTEACANLLWACHPDTADIFGVPDACVRASCVTIPRTCLLVHLLLAIGTPVGYECCAAAPGTRSWFAHSGDERP